MSGPTMSRVRKEPVVLGSDAELIFGVGSGCSEDGSPSEPVKLCRPVWSRVTGLFLIG